jgi:NADPH:quinone reductase-like Zn-dependent oxidoreductase
MRGFYNGDFKFPLVPGNEGSGTVISSGGGLMAWTLIGKRVAFVKP